MRTWLCSIVSIVSVMPGAMAQVPRPADTLARAADAIDPIAKPQAYFDAWTTALTALKAEQPQRSAEIANAMRARSDALLSLSRTDEAIAEAEAALKLLGTGRDADIVRAGLFTALGQGLDHKSDWPQAADYYRKAGDLRRTLFGAESAEVARSEADLGLELTKTGKTTEARALLEHSFAILDRTEARTSIARLSAGLYLANLRHTIDPTQGPAIDLLNRLLAESLPLGPTHPMVSQLRSQLAAALLKAGRFNDSIAMFRATLDALKVAGDTNLATLADSQMSAAMAMQSLDRPTDTQPMALEASKTFAAVGQTLSSAAALIVASNMARQLDEPTLALTHANAAMALATGGPNRVELAIALFKGTLAGALAANGQLGDALTAQTESVAGVAAVRALGHPQRNYAESQLAWLKAKTGDAPAALALIKPQIVQLIQRGRSSEIAQSRATPMSGSLTTFGQAMEIAFLANDAGFGFLLAQVLTESDAGRATLATLAKLSANSPETAQRLDRRRALLGQRLDLDSERLAKITDAAATAAIGARIATIDAEVAEIEAALKRDFPEFDTLLRPAPETLAAVQQRIAPGETLVVPVTTYHGFYTFALTRDRVAWGRSPLSRTGVRRLIERIRAGVLPSGTVRAGEDASTDIATARVAFDRVAAAELHAAIFTPPVAALTDKARLLSIAADDVMSTIPLSLLPTGPGPRAPWLIERVALRVVPAIAALGRTGTETSARDGFVGVGAPARSATVDPNASALVKAVALLPTLPGATTELRAMATAVGGTRGVLLTGSDATETRLRASARRGTRVIAFATHGLVSGDFDTLTEPALLLAPEPGVAGAGGDGLLTASEAATLDLDAEWIILSACNTASGDQLSAAGYSGLARAFLFAGGHQVLASHWPVRDDVSARLTVETIRASRRGQSGAEALRTAMLKLMRDKTTPGARDPALWAPYMVISR